ncbi:MAG: bacillithiol biosynthesis cysteine-adding enzyme BshC [Gemmatimonadaceae bacterium]|nr:bacillithiol biosynthesis cysteine-adding enzyme BshC [Gemmatimonadaceae bacterium]
MTGPRLLTEALEGGALTRTALDQRAPEGWYPPRPLNVEQWRTRAEATRSGARAWLESLRPAFDAKGAAKERLERVAIAGGVVVTTGQQPGLFGGPGYTILKALSALALADRIEADTGIPAAPVFWAATDDADFEEARWTTVAIDGTARHLALDRRGADGMVMAEYPLGETRAVLEALATAAGSVSAPHVLDAARDAYGARGATIGGAYVRLLRSLLEPLGIPVLDAWHPAVREQARPTLLDALRRASAVDEAVSLRTVAIERTGFRAQVQRVPRLSLVFRSQGGVKERVPLLQAAEVAAQSDAVLSANVLLRPVVERAILPTVAYVGGPGEIAYFAQVSAVADTLGVPVPLIVPRWSATVIEPNIDRMLGRLGMVVEDVRVPHLAEKRIGDRGIANAVRDALAALRAEVHGKMDGLRDAVHADRALVPAPVLEGARHQLLHRMERLERRLRRAAAQREADAMHDLAEVRAALVPEGERQERRLNFLPMLARHGDALLAPMRAGAALHAGQLVGPK